MECHAAMTVTTSTNKTIVLGNGVTGPPGQPFTFDFIGVNALYISVTYTDANGVDTLLDTSAYTLTLAPGTPPNWGIGGTVAYPLTGPAIANGTKLTILRNLPLVQAITIINQASFGQYASAAETAVDLQEMQLQQVNGNFSRAVVAPPSDPNLNLVLPPAAQRALQLMGFDSSGQPIAAQPSNALVSSVMQPVVAANTLASARNLMGIDTSNLLPVGVEADWPGLFPPTLWLFEDGALKSRATYALLFNVLCPTIACVVSNGLNSIPGIADTSGFAIGWAVEGVGIPGTTTISAITGPNSISINHPATGNGTSIRIFPFGQGDAVSTFQLPNATGRAYAGVDNAAAVFAAAKKLGDTAGTETVALLPTQMPVHTHVVTDPTHLHDINNAQNGAILYYRTNEAGGGGPAQLVVNYTGDTVLGLRSTAAATGITNQNAGSGQSHSNVQPTSFRRKIIYAGV